MAIDKSTSPLARRSRDAELWRLLGQRSRDATLKRKAKNEPSPREASQSCQLTRTSQLILPAHRRSSRGCTPRLHPHCSSAQPILAPSAAVLRGRQRAQPAGARGTRHTSALPAPRAGTGREGGNPESRTTAIRQCGIVQGAYRPASEAQRLRPQLFV